MLWVVALCGVARAQCYTDPHTGRQICAKPPLGRELGAERQAASAHCRITVGDGSTGSGTLVARNDHAGLVLTCSHLFDRTTSNVIVLFPDGQRFDARVLQRDRAHDLAALVIQRPDIEPIEMRKSDGVIAGGVSACGFGPSGQFRCIRGDIVGQATPVGAVYPSLTIRGSVRPGDSGGAVLTASGELIGVVWGERGGLTYAACGRPLVELLGCVIGAESTAVHEDNDRPKPKDIVSPLPAQIAALDARLRALDGAKQNKGDYVRRNELTDYVRRDDIAAINFPQLESIHQRVETIRATVEKVAASKVGVFHGLSFGKLIAGALGLSSPLAAALVIASGLVRRRWKFKQSSSKLPSSNLQSEFRNPQSPIAVDTPPPPQRTMTETHYVPYEIDSFAKAHQWASEQVARKYPGATEMLQAQDSLIKQFLTAQQPK